MIPHSDQLVALITSWVNGPFRNVTIQMIAFFIAVKSLEFGLDYLTAWLKRRKNKDNHSTDENYKNWIT